MTGLSQVTREGRCINEPRPLGSGDRLKNRSLTATARKRLPIGRLLAIALRRMIRLIVLSGRACGNRDMILACPIHAITKWSFPRRHRPLQTGRLIHTGLFCPSNSTVVTSTSGFTATMPQPPTRDAAPAAVKACVLPSARAEPAPVSLWLSKFNGITDPPWLG